jgi:hypothetical protein
MVQYHQHFTCVGAGVNDRTDLGDEEKELVTNELTDGLVVSRLGEEKGEGGIE